MAGDAGKSDLLSELTSSILHKAPPGFRDPIAAVRRTRGLTNEEPFFY